MHETCFLLALKRGGDETRFVATSVGLRVWGTDVSEIGAAARGVEQLRASGLGRGGRMRHSVEGFALQLYVGERG